MPTCIPISEGNAHRLLENDGVVGENIRRRDGTRHVVKASELTWDGISARCLSARRALFP